MVWASLRASAVADRIMRQRELTDWIGPGMQNAATVNALGRAHADHAEAIAAAVHTCKQLQDQVDMAYSSYQAVVEEVRHSLAGCSGGRPGKPHALCTRASDAST